MYTTVFTILSILFLAVPVTPMPVNETTMEARSRSMKPGTATYFYPGLGACGHTDDNNVPLVALSHLVFNMHRDCNKHLEVKYPKTGKTTTVRVRDMCPGCDATHLDLSPIVWQKLGADEALGVIDIEFSGLH